MVTFVFSVHKPLGFPMQGSLRLGIAIQSIARLLVFGFEGFGR